MGNRTKNLILATAFSFAAVSAHAACDGGTVLLKGDWGFAQFNVEVADDGAERSLGLMNRPEMARSAGMLFLYEQPHRASFWMRNTLIPLDMIFVGEDGIVTRIHENAVPLDETPIDGGEGVIAVLEINGGLAKGLGITVGSELKHPFFDPAVVWPCPGFE